MMKAKRSNVNMEKLTVMTIAFNGVQILSSLLIALICLLDAEVLGRPYLRVGLVILTALVSWGAFMDVREAYMVRHLSEETDMLEESHRNLEELNGEMRKQRHDFMNHLQVVYSLVELGDTRETCEYIERVYGDLKRVGRNLKPSMPAVNALIAAKEIDAGEQGVLMKTDVRSALENFPLEGWEMCRVLGNLIDNAFDALKGRKAACVSVEIGETREGFHIAVENNGPPIPPELKEKIFEERFSTKGEERGMGLAIVREIVESVGGTIAVHSNERKTRFEIDIPGQGRQEETI